MRRSWVRIPSRPPQFTARVLAGNETNELGEELVGSNLYQVHLYHELESNNYDLSCQPTMHIKRSSGLVCRLDRSDFEPVRNFCAAQLTVTAEAAVSSPFAPANSLPVALGVRLDDRAGTDGAKIAK